MLFETGNILGGHVWHLEERTVCLEDLSGEFRSQTAWCWNTAGYQADICQPKLFVIGCEVLDIMREDLSDALCLHLDINRCVYSGANSAEIGILGLGEKSIGLTKAGFSFIWQMIVYVFGGREVQRMLPEISKKQFRLVEALSWSGDAFPMIVRWILSLCKEPLLNKLTKLTYWKVPLFPILITIPF